MYPNTSGCFSFLNNRVMTPAHISIRAKSLIRGDNSDIYFSFCYIYRKINALFYHMQTSVILSRGEILFSAYS